MNLVRKIFQQQGYMLLKEKVVPKGLFLHADLKRTVHTHLIKKIVDVGGYHGDMVHFFSTIFPNAFWKVYEPTKKNFEFIANRFQSNSKIAVYNKGVGATAGKLIFQEYENGELNSFKKIDENILLVNHHEVEVVDLDSDLKDWNTEGIDLVKIDVEGFELEVLKGMSQLLDSNKIGMIYIEVGFCEDDDRHTSFELVKKQLVEKGFSFYGLYDLYHYRKSTELLFSNALFLNDEYLHKNGLIQKNLIKIGNDIS